MSTKPYGWKQSLRRVAICIGLFYVLICAAMFGLQRTLLYFPSHVTAEGRLEPWVDEGNVIGFRRQVDHPDTVWLMMHGNGGQASHRDYVLQRLSPADALYVLEYPGYGERSVSPVKMRSMQPLFMHTIA